MTEAPLGNRRIQRCARLGSGFLGLGEDEAVVVIVVAVIVRQTTVARDDVEDDLAAFEIETELEFAQAGIAHRFAEARLVFFAVEHEKATAARAGNLAAYGAVGLGELVPGVDVRIRNAVGEALFGKPVDVEKLSEAAKI